MRSLRSPRRYARGVTLIELMVTVAIIAVLAALALPSFGRTLASNRISTGVNDFIAAASVARMEAIRRNTEAGICAANATNTGCSTDWNNGYLVYYMTNATPPVMEVVRTGAFSSKDTAVSATGDIRFDRRGQLAAATHLSYRPLDASYLSLERCVRVSLAGAVSAATGAC